MVKLKQSASKVLFLSIVAVVFLATTQTWATPLPTTFILKIGYSAVKSSLGAEGGLDYLPNGDLIVLNAASAPQIQVVDANGDGQPATPQTLATIESGSFGSFLKVSPDGTFALFGTTGTQNSIRKIHLSTRQITAVTDVAGNNSMSFVDNKNVIISANGGFDPSSPNQLIHINLDNPAVKKVVAEFLSPSGPVAVNDSGDLYYVKSTWTFPPPANSHHLYKFEAAQLQSAIDNGIVLKDADSRIDVLLDSGYGLAINSFNDLFVSLFSGKILKVDELTGEKEVFVSDEGSFTNIAIYKPSEFFNAYQKSTSKIAFAAADIFFSNPSIIQIQPALDDSFADEVVSFRPGLTGGTSANLVLGAPVGGGTVNPNFNSLVLLGDRDNPDANSPATVDVKFNHPITDDARNRYGLDAIVFSNSFWANANPQQRFSEPALIEVSQDFNHDGIANDEWFLIQPNVLPQNLGSPIPLTLTLRNYAEFSPTLMLGDTNADNVVDVPGMTVEDFYTVPDKLCTLGDAQSYQVDPNSGGGDAFDLRDAVVQASDGVAAEVGGRKKYPFLERVDFVRLRDAVNGDANVGRATAEIDAVSDARAGLIGNRIAVNTIAALQTALSTATAGDEIVIAPGTYALTSSLQVPVGVSLSGSSGLWTVNIKEDDVIFNAEGMAPAQPALVMRDVAGNFQSAQGYGISGIHFVNCNKAISLQDTYPTIENNFFEDTATALEITNVSDETIVIRHNVFGHQVTTQPTTGINAQNSKIALTHNTFVNFSAAAVEAGVGVEAYLRDNIFANNQTGINAASSNYVSGHNNLFFDNAQNYLINQGSLTMDILVDPEFALAPQGDYRLAAKSAARKQGMGGADPGAYDGPNFYPFNTRIGFYLDLKKFPWYQSLNNGVDPIEKYSGAAVAKMWLTYLWWNKINHPDGPPELTDPQLRDQAWLYNFGHLQNYAVNASLNRLDARGLWYTVQNLDPAYNPYHYNFAILTQVTKQRALNDICYWIAYPAGGGSENPFGVGVNGHPVHVPVAVATGGNYDRWMAVRGVRTTADPYTSSRYGIFGFWINDPHPSGIGQNSYKTVEQFTANYFLPLANINPQDPHFNKWVTIAEPPIDKKDKIKMFKGKKRLKKAIRNRLQSQTLSVDDMDKRIMVEDHPDEQAFDIIKAAVEGLQEELLDYDDQLADIFDETLPSKPLFVSDPCGDYYIVSFQLPVMAAEKQQILNFKDAIKILGKSKKHQLRKKINKWAKFQSVDGNNAQVIEKVKMGRHDAPVRRTAKTSSKNLTKIVAIVDAKDGRFKEASWVKEPTKYLKVGRAEALRILARKLLNDQTKSIKDRLVRGNRNGWLSVQDNNELLRLTQIVKKELLNGAEINLVRQESSFYEPSWRIEYYGIAYLVDQAGRITME